MVRAVLDYDFYLFRTGVAGLSEVYILRTVKIISGEVAELWYMRFGYFFLKKMKFMLVFDLY